MEHSKIFVNSEKIIKSIIKRCPKKDLTDDRPKDEQQWCLYTKDKDRLLGRHPTKDDAVKQEQLIQIRKHKGSVDENIFNKQNFYRYDHYGPEQDKTVFYATQNDDHESGVFLVHFIDNELKFMRCRTPSRFFINHVKNNEYYPVTRQDVIDWHSKINIQEYYK